MHVGRVGRSENRANARGALISSLIIREAEKADIPAMARIRAQTWGSEEYWNARIAAYLDGQLHPKHSLTPRVGYVAADGESLVGLVAGHLTQRFGCDGELEWIDVIPERRGSGAAAELLRRLAKWFVEHKAFRICVDVQPTNTTARRFYVRHGAEPLNPHWLFWKDIQMVLGKTKS